VAALQSELRSIPYQDRVGAIDLANSGHRITIELGCGPAKRHRDAIGIDQLNYPGVDIVGDVFDVLGALQSACVSTVYTYHFLEHVPDLNRLVRELGRVLVPGGSLVVEVPHFANPYQHSDPTHVRTFGLYTFCYLSRSNLFRRCVPMYGLEPDFELVRAILQFSSPFRIRKGIRQILGSVFNLCAWTKEFHEENLCYVFPAYQIRFELRRL
jgi:SAM-dependent methyltransferase